MNNTQNQHKTIGMSNWVWLPLVVATTILITLVLMVMSSAVIGEPVRAQSDEALSLPLVIHLATVIPAIPLGAFVLLRKKGDAMHKLLGRIWAALMLTTAIASFGLGDFGEGIMGLGLSFIHLFSILTLVSIPLAIWRVRVGDMQGHYQALQGTYVGLIIAGLFSFLPGRLLGSLVF